MIPVTIILKGDNRLIKRRLLQVDGVTALALSDLSAVQCELIQTGKIQATFVLGTDPELRAGTDANELVLELAAARTSALMFGPLKLRWQFQIPDAGFTVDLGGSTDRIAETPATIQSETSLTGRTGEIPEANITTLFTPTAGGDGLTLNGDSITLNGDRVTLPSAPSNGVTLAGDNVTLNGDPVSL